VLDGEGFKRCKPQYWGEENVCSGSKRKERPVALDDIPWLDQVAVKRVNTLDDGNFALVSVPPAPSSAPLLRDGRVWFEDMSLSNVPRNYFRVDPPEQSLQVWHDQEQMVRERVWDSMYPEGGVDSPPPRVEVLDSDDEEEEEEGIGIGMGKELVVMGEVDDYDGVMLMDLTD
jgi:hypothetical protein